MATFRSVFSRGCDAGISFFDAGIVVIESGSEFIKETAGAAKDTAVDLVYSARAYAKGFREEAEAANSDKVLKERARTAEEEALAELAFRRESLKKRKAELGILDETKPEEKKQETVNVANVGQELKEEKNG